MTHAHATLIRGAYDALNRRDLDRFVEAFAEDAVWHGGGADLRGRERIREVVDHLIALSGDTLHIELHDVLANDDHVVVLQITTARRGDDALADRVVYVYHVVNGSIEECWFNGDPRIQDRFWSGVD